jgi:hypothetical protein
LCILEIDKGVVLMADMLLLVIVLTLIVLAVRYLIKEQKKGSKCLGCPMAATCAKKKNSCN